MNKRYSLELAQSVAEEVVGWLAGGCTRIKVVGSVRRECASVHDLDLVVIPQYTAAGQQELFGEGKKRSLLDERLVDLSFRELLHVQANGPKVKRFIHCHSGMPVDIYVADIKSWATLLVIRTGSEKFNRRLCATARKLTYILHADGRGIETSKGKFNQPRTELGLFQALGIPYVRPKDRVG